MNEFVWHFLFWRVHVLTVLDGVVAHTHLDDCLVRGGIYFHIGCTYVQIIQPPLPILFGHIVAGNLNTSNIYKQKYSFFRRTISKKEDSVVIAVIYPIGYTSALTFLIIYVVNLSTSA